MRKILFCLVLLLSTNFVTAHSIESFNTEIEVYNDGVAKVVNSLIFNSTEKEELVIPAYFPESIIATDDKGELKFAVLEKEIMIRPRKNTDNYKVRLQYLTNSVTSKKEGLWSIKYEIPPYKYLKYDSVKKSGIIFSFPSSVTLTSFTDNAVIFTDKQELKAGWKIDLDEHKSTIIELDYKLGINTEPDIIRILFYSIISIVAVVLVFSVGKYGLDKFTKRLSMGKKDILKTLEKREVEVIQLLLNNQNKMYQSKIQKDTGISKATLSRIIKRLENKNIIEVRPTGNTNLILLQEWFVKK